MMRMDILTQAGADPVTLRKAFGGYVVSRKLFSRNCGGSGNVLI
jgi:hypothetical protein